MAMKTSAKKVPSLFGKGKVSGRWRSSSNSGDSRDSFNISSNSNSKSNSNSICESTDERSSVEPKSIMGRYRKQYCSLIVGESERIQNPLKNALLQQKGMSKAKVKDHGYKVI